MNHSRDIIRNRFTNKDTAFTTEEREKHDLVAWFPYKVETLEQQVARCESQFDALPDDLSKWVYLTRIQDSNEILFYSLITKNVKKFLPIVYTPTVGAACTRYSEVWASAPRGFYLNREHQGKIRRILDTWPFDVKIIVVTDGTRILGLGDLGTGGHQICVGKLTLYTVGGGFDPLTALPISFDFGASKPEIRDHPHYLGRPEDRIKDEVYYDMVKELVLAVKDKWPTSVFQFEDFSNDTAFDLLARHRRHGLAVFNDDITGTGCVTAGAVLGGLRAASTLTGRKVMAKEQRIVMFGAGAGGIGVAERIAILMTEEGLTEADALRNFWIVDSQGLITKDRADYQKGTIQEHKLPWARDDLSNADYKNLITVIKHVKPTILLGLSTIGKSFNREIVETTAALCPEYPPMIFALSNPTSKAECTPQECYEFAKGHCLYTSGSPFPPVDCQRRPGLKISTSQCNNLYVFPAIGMGSSICEATEISDLMISAVSHGLSELLSDELIARDELLPDISDIRNISAFCAMKLIRQAEKEGLARRVMPKCDKVLLEQIKAWQWNPAYK